MEEQIRMAAAGYDSMFRHPGSYIALQIGKKRGKVLDEAGNLLTEGYEHKKAMSQQLGDWTDHATVATGLRTTFYKSDTHRWDLLGRAWHSELSNLAADPVAREVARAETFDDALDWFTRGAGNKFRGDLAAAHPGMFDSPEQARAYLEIVQQRINYHTAGNEDLIDAVKTGKLGGHELIVGTDLNPKARKVLDGYVADFAPETVIGEETVTVGSTRSKWLDKAVDNLFSGLMTRPTNYFSRSPTFIQAYQQEVKRLRPAVAAGRITTEEMDLLAKGHGLEQTKELLYDLTRKGRFMDAARLIFPFGEAWSEMFTRWLGTPSKGFRDGLFYTHPQSVRRLQQVIQGARGPDFGAVMGAPEDLEGNQLGFFWNDPIMGESFVYPGSGILTDNLLGVQIPLTGRVQGLNMFGTLVPGFGPAVQLPVGWILDTKPGPQWLKEALGRFESADLGPLGTVEEALLPFGAPGAEDQSKLFDLTTYAPTWMRTLADLATGGDVSEKQWGDAVMATMAYLRSTGQYGRSKADMQQLAEDAQHKARGFYLVKMMGQLTLPSSPAPDWRVLTQDDKSVRLRALADEYAQFRQEDFETADQRFLDRWGEDILDAVLPHTKAAEYGLPTTKQGAQWVIEHPGIEDDLPHTYGFFAPTSDDPDDFDYSLYQRQLREGDRVQLDPEVWNRLSQNVRAQMLYSQAKDSIPPDMEGTDEASAFLIDVRHKLDDQYPGWSDSSGLPQRPELDDLMRELYEARDNRVVRDTEAGQALIKYLAARDEVLSWAISEGHERSNGLLSTSQDVTEGHLALREYGERLKKNHPAFESLWDIVLSRELEEPEK